MIVYVEKSQEIWNQPTNQPLLVWSQNTRSAQSNQRLFYILTTNKWKPKLNSTIYSSSFSALLPRLSRSIRPWFSLSICYHIGYQLPVSWSLQFMPVFSPLRTLSFHSPFVAWAWVFTVLALPLKSLLGFWASCPHQPSSRSSVQQSQTSCKWNRNDEFCVISLKLCE